MVFSPYLRKRGEKETARERERETARRERTIKAITIILTLGSLPPCIAFSI